MPLDARTVQCQEKGMGKADERRAAIVAQQAAREEAEREARKLEGPVTPARKPRVRGAGTGMRGRPPRNDRPDE